MKRFIVLITGLVLLIAISCKKDNINTDDIDRTTLWEPGEIFEPSFPNNIVFHDSMNIWFTSIKKDSGTSSPVYVFKSSDGGIAWSKNIIPNSLDRSTTNLSPANPTTAFICMAGTGLLKTSNNGSNWSVVNQTSVFRDKDVYIHFFNESQGIAVYVKDNDNVQNSADTVKIIRTTNGGESWSPVSEPGEVVAGEGILYSGNDVIEAIGDTLAFATNLGRIFFSYDRGDTWQNIIYDTYPYEAFSTLALLTSESFALTSVGKAVLTDGTYILTPYPHVRVITTQNKGVTWATPANLTELHRGNISALPGSEAYVVTGSMSLSKPGGTFLSVDEGKNFVSADTMNFNVAITSFYSMYHGFGASYNHNVNPLLKNAIFRWNYLKVREEFLRK